MDAAYRHSLAGDAATSVRTQLSIRGPPPNDLAVEFAALLGAPPPTEHAVGVAVADADDPVSPCGTPMPAHMAVESFWLAKTNSRALWEGVPRVPAAGTHGTHH